MWQSLFVLKIGFFFGKKISHKKERKKKSSNTYIHVQRTSREDGNWFNVLHRRNRGGREITDFLFFKKKKKGKKEREKAKKKRRGNGITFLSNTFLSLGQTTVEKVLQFESTSFGNPSL